MDIYDRINILLKEKKITKMQMCEDMGISYNTLSSWFKRRSANVDVPTMKSIADYLGTTLEYLINANEQYKYADNSSYYDTNTIIVVKGKDDKKYYKLSDQDFNAMQTILKQFDK